MQLDKDSSPSHPIYHNLVLLSSGQKRLLTFTQKSRQIIMSGMLKGLKIWRGACKGQLISERL